MTVIAQCIYVTQVVFVVYWQRGERASPSHKALQRDAYGFAAVKIGILWASYVLNCRFSLRSSNFQHWRGALLENIEVQRLPWALHFVLVVTDKPFNSTDVYLHSPDAESTGSTSMGNIFYCCSTKQKVIHGLNRKTIKTVKHQQWTIRITCLRLHAFANQSCWNLHCGSSKMSILHCYVCIWGKLGWLAC